MTTQPHAAEPVKIYPCPLPECPWSTISEPPGPAENPGALADHFGYGVFAAHATAERLERKERELADHLALHTPQEFGIALATANKRVAELERQVADGLDAWRLAEHAAVSARQIATEILASYVKTPDGYRGRVGQQQIARWQGRLDGVA